MGLLHEHAGRGVQGGPLKVPPDQLLAFLRAVDAELECGAEVVLIGGTALSFYARSHATDDVDYIGRLSRAVESAVERLRERGVPVIPLHGVGVFFPPESFDERLQRVEPNLERLRVFIPERHDLAIMKVARGFAHDLEGVEELHAAEPLELEVLIERFAETDVTGSTGLFAEAFLDLVSRLFGQAEANRVRCLLPK